MTFDPMKFYEDGQRKQRRYNSLVPVFLVAVALLVGFYAFFVAYQRSHVKPKPETGFQDTQTVVWADCGGVGEKPCIMSKCNGEGYVTDLKDCKTPNFAATFMVPLDEPRKHKRKAVCVAVNEYIDGAGDSDFWMIPGTMIWFPTHRECNKFWANPIPLWAGAHPIVWNKPDCLTGGSVKGDIPPCNHVPGLFNSEVECHGIDDAAICNTNPPRQQDFELGAGSGDNTWKSAEYDQLVLDHSQDFYDNAFVPGGLCTDRERYRELQCVSDDKCKLRNRDEWFWCNSESTTPQDITNLMERIAPTPTPKLKLEPDPDSPHFKCPEGGCPHLDLSGSNVAAPDCKMPADIDVCPAQMLEHKGVSDEGVDWKKYGVRDGKVKP